MKRSYWTCIWGGEGKDFAEVCLGKPLPRKHLIYVILSFSFPIHLSFDLFQLEYHTVYGMATAFEIHFVAP